MKSNMSLMQVLVVLIVVPLSVHVGSLAAAPVRVEVPSPQAVMGDPPSSSSEGEVNALSSYPPMGPLPISADGEVNTPSVPVPVSAEGVVRGPSPVPPQQPRLCNGQPLLGETQVREIVEELMQRNGLSYDEEDQTPTRTK